MRASASAALAPLRLMALGTVLTACSSSSGTPPSVALSSPAVGTTLGGTVAVQVTARDDEGIAKVQLYARAPGSEATGVLLGSAAAEPYVISVNTAVLPSGNDLELYAVASDRGGTQGTSDPVRVRVVNAGAPELRYLVAYTMPPQPTASTASLRSRVAAQSVRAPAGLRAASTPVQPTATEGNAEFLAEWAWNTTGGANGYRVYLSKGDLAGPYDLVYAQTPGSAALQKYSGAVTGVKAGDTVHGTVSPLSGAGLAEGPKSNADAARFLSMQEVASPAEGQSVPGGRPTLTWSALSGAQGYLYRVYDKHPYDAAAREVWGNGTTVTTAQSAAYPASKAALPSGTYHWWVAGVRFGEDGASEAFSFSEPRTLVVP